MLTYSHRHSTTDIKIYYVATGLAYDFAARIALRIGKGRVSVQPWFSEMIIIVRGGAS